MVGTDGLWQKVTGTVTEVRQTAAGVTLKVEATPPRARYPERVTVWGVPGNFSKGDRVTVSGEWSFRKKPKTNAEGDFWIDFSLNNPVVIEHEAVKLPDTSSTWDTVAPAADPGESNVWHEPGSTL